MNIIKPSFSIENIDKINGNQILRNIEMVGRVAHKSEDKLADFSARQFAKMLIRLGHESVLEHESITVRFVCDRGVSHEIVRHRIASFTQESTRYCNYAKKEFGEEISVIFPYFLEHDEEGYNLWYQSTMVCEEAYLGLIARGYSPGEARSVLPNSLKTEVVMTCNLREWRHFFKLRTSKSAHPQLREIAIPLLVKLKELIPVIFDDIPTTLEP